LFYFYRGALRSVQLNTCNGRKNQKFTFTEQGFLRSLLFSDKCASVKKSTLISTDSHTRLASADNASPITLKNCDNTSGDKWFIIPFSAGISLIEPKTISHVKASRSVIEAVVTKWDNEEEKYIKETKTFNNAMSLTKNTISPDDVTVNVESCELLSIPVSSTKWPTVIYQDE